MRAHKTTCRDATGPKRNTSHCTAPALFPWKWRVHFRDSSEETWHGLQPLCWRCVSSRCHWVPLMPDTMVTCHLKVTSSSPSLVWNDAFPATCPATHSSCYPGNHPTLIPIDAKSSTRATGCLIFSSPLKWLPTWFTHIRTLFLILDCSNLTSGFVFMFYPLSHWWLFPPSSGLSVLQASVTQGGSGSSHLGPRLSRELPPTSLGACKWTYSISSVCHKTMTSWVWKPSSYF